MPAHFTLTNFDMPAKQKCLISWFIYSCIVLTVIILLLIRFDVFKFFSLPKLLKNANGDLNGDNLKNANDDCYKALQLNNTLIRVNVSSHHLQSYVTVNFKGRLGNLMFQYASLLGICNMTNHLPVIPKNLEIVKYFHNVHHTAESCSDSLKWIDLHSVPQLEEREPKLFDVDLIKTLQHNLSESNVKLEGYFQTWKYFQHITGYIHLQFRFHPKIMKPLALTIEELKLNNNATIMIGVHIRRGDYVNMPELYAMADEKYLLRAMKYYADKHGKQNILFLICSTSDGLEWFASRANVSAKQYKVEYSRNHTPIEDLILLSSADHLILTVGTFGWWPGYLSKGSVIYYRNIWGDNMTAFQLQLLDNFFPPHWISL